MIFTDEKVHNVLNEGKKRVILGLLVPVKRRKEKKKGGGGGGGEGEKKKKKGKSIRKLLAHL